MKVINYTAFKKIEDSIYKQKAAEKSSNPVPEASNSRDIRFFFVNSRSVIFHVDPSRNVKESNSKIKFRVD